MRRLSRVLLGAALVVGVLTANSPTTRAAEPDKLLPAEADTVVSVNIKQILDTDIIKKYALEQLKQALDGQDAKKLLTEIGLDPLKDIDRVVVGANFKSPADIKYLMIVHGNFDPDRLYKAAEKQSKVDADRFAMIKDGDTVVFKYTAGERREPGLRHRRQRQDRHRRVRSQDDRQRPQGRRGRQEGADQDGTRRPGEAHGREVLGLRLRPHERASSMSSSCRRAATFPST